MSRTSWADYLAEFHDARPGITEDALTHAADPLVGTAYDWLAQGLAGPAGCVLDLACGNAALLPRLSAHARYVGVDCSPGELEQGRRQGRGALARGDLRDLPVRDASVDVVMSSMGLMLVQPVEQALSEVHRVLRPGGRVALLLPATWPLHLRDLSTVLRLALALRGPGSMPQQLGPRRVRRLLSAAGLPVESAERRRFPFPLETPEDARLAIRALYTPDRTPQQLAAAERLLLARAGRGVTLPVPLLRVVACRAGDGSAVG